MNTYLVFRIELRPTGRPSRGGVLLFFLLRNINILASPTERCFCMGLASKGSFNPCFIEDIVVVAGPKVEDSGVSVETLSLY